jgi:hypothetical protein
VTSPGCTATAACRCATNATTGCMTPSSISAVPSSAGSYFIHSYEYF